MTILPGSNTVFFCSFVGQRRVAVGDLKTVVNTTARLVALPLHDAKSSEQLSPQIPLERVAFYNESTGQPIEIDLDEHQLTLAQQMDIILAALNPLEHDLSTDSHTDKGPGRPKLGVESREISLLPRQWQWLSKKGKNTSAVLRKLVDQSWLANRHEQQLVDTRDAAHRFMWDMAGNLPNFEEASRAFYREDFVQFYEHISSWPNDIREQTRKMVETWRFAITQAALSTTTSNR